MEILDILERFGWLGVVIVWTLPRVWGFLTDRFYPQKVKEREERIREREDGVRAEREARATLIRAQIERENRESDARIEVDRRFAAALEQMTLAITVGNERITAVMATLSQHVNFTFGAHVELKERLEQIDEKILFKGRVDELEQRLTDTQEKMKSITTK